MKRLLGKLGLLISCIGLGIGCILSAFGNVIGIPILLAAALTYSFVGQVK